MARHQMVCDIHGEQSHTKGKGCPKCAVYKRNKAMTSNTDKVLGQFKDKWDDRYDYSLMEYKNAYTKIKIICKEHGVFEQQPQSHRKSQGCKKCASKERPPYVRGDGPLTQSKVLEQFYEVHKDLYDYSLVAYVKATEKVKIICKEHGVFEQTPSSHKQGATCGKCASKITGDKLRSSLDKILKEFAEVHGDRYDYSQVVYRTSKIKIKIICKVHGAFEQYPLSHRNNAGCPTCSSERVSELASKRAKTTGQFIKEAQAIHLDRYNYDEVEYKRSGQHVKILCHDHGVFEQVPYTHLEGKGCPRCQHNGEGRIAGYLLQEGIVQRQYSIEGKRFDFYLPEHNLIIERDGRQHYKDVDLFKSKVEYQQANDAHKVKLVKDRGIRIARIPFWLTPQEEIQEVKNILNNNATYPEVPDISHLKTQPKPKT